MSRFYFPRFLGLLCESPSYNPEAPARDAALCVALSGLWGFWQSLAQTQLRHFSSLKTKPTHNVAINHKAQLQNSRFRPVSKLPLSSLIAIALSLLGIASSTFAQTPTTRVSTPSSPTADAPEKLLSPTTQLFVRWDGITAHNEAYKKSFWGGLMAGPTGGSIRTLLAEWPKLLGSSQLADPLVEGKPLEELKT